MPWPHAPCLRPHECGRAAISAWCVNGEVFTALFVAFYSVWIETKIVNPHNRHSTNSIRINIDWQFSRSRTRALVTNWIIHLFKFVLWMSESVFTSHDSKLRCRRGQLSSYIQHCSALVLSFVFTVTHSLGSRFTRFDRPLCVCVCRYGEIEIGTNKNPNHKQNYMRQLLPWRTNCE